MIAAPDSVKGNTMTSNHTITRTRTTRAAGVLAVLAAGMLALAGCGTTDAAPSDEAVPAGESVTVTDAWVKAADSGMTAVFGMLENTGGDDVAVVSATTAAAGATELHETVTDSSGAATMREVEGGFTIGAGERRALEPGADHLMLMGLTGPLAAGEEISVLLEFSDGSTLEFTAPVKDFSGANEDYDGGDGDMGEMEMGD